MILFASLRTGHCWSRDERPLLWRLPFWMSAMQHSTLGSLGPVSRLTLGGGGIGMVWGSTTRHEASATIRAAIDAGINVLDTAPMYGACEAIIGETFGGQLPAGVRVTTKCGLGSPEPAEVANILTQSLEASLAAMRLDHVDIFFLHSNICADGYLFAHRPEQQKASVTDWSIYCEQFIPVMERLQTAGKIRAWGITGVGVPATIKQALSAAHRPAVVQAVTNLLDSAGAMRRYAEPANPRDIIATANANGVGVMGIRAVQAGALTSAIDRAVPPTHPEGRDFARAAPFRELCARLGEDPALLAHRYALSMAGVSTVVLGVKNRTELNQCVDAERQGPLPAELNNAIEALGLRK